MQICSFCGVDKPDSDFWRDSTRPSGLWVYCKQCESVRQAGDRHLRTPPSREQKSRWQRKTRYGLTQEAFDALLRGQNHQCGICDKPLEIDGERKDRPHVDHDHETGKVRGILCHACNIRIGGWDSPTFRERALAWIQQK